MKKVFAFIADGFEEVECLAVVDLLRRADIETQLVSITAQKTVAGSHGIIVTADKLYSEIDCGTADLLFLPGGGGGTKALQQFKPLHGQLLEFAANSDKRLAAICAAPSVFGILGILKGKNVTCYPGFEKYCDGAIISEKGVVTDGRITTAKGMGVSIEFGLELVALLESKELADSISAQIQR